MTAAGAAAPYLNRCTFGDVRAVLAQMIRDGVKAQTIITSPPYFGLRSYLPDGHPHKGLELGNEASLPEFIANMTSVFALAREVLADDGVLWMNMGDAYAGSWGAQSTAAGLNSTGTISARAIAAMAHRSSKAGSPSRTPGLKPKDLMGQPWRLALALQDAGWWLRQDVIWHKPNPMPESTRDRFTKSHEYLFVLTKSERYYWDFEAAQEPVTVSHRTPSKTGVGFGHGFDAAPKDRVKKPAGWDSSEGGHHGNAGRYEDAMTHGAAGAGAGKRMGREPGWRQNTEIPTTRNRRSVWTIPTQKFEGAHFATFPEALIEPCVLIASRPGDVVLDIFFGSGTTGQVAQRLGRNWMGIDLNEGYAPLQAGRTAQQGLELGHA